MKTQAAQSQNLIDPMDPARARALQAALGITPDISSGSPLPPFFHQIYFWDPQTPDLLGRDGHTGVGGFIPDLGLPRRMWAAGRLVFHAPLLAGSRAERISVIEAVTRKTGKSGPLAFVRIRHDIRQRQALVLSEWQELVYREDGALGAPPAAPTQAAESETLSFDSTLLFRYSALTMNGHRIHYDADYARDVEGYDGLVVHGPLLAQTLMLMAEERAGVLRSFSYKATAPLICTEEALFCADGPNLWVTGSDGRLCMSAKAD